MAERQAKAAAPRKRALMSCDRCKLRRARCIRDNAEEACADCKASGVECESKLPRKQRVYGSVETLSLRYRALDSLVKGLFPQENIQDIDTLFKLAAARNIPMPATDDFTPADIFNNNKSERQAQSQQSQQQQHQPSPHVSRMSHNDSVHSVKTPSSVSTNKDDQRDQRNPFLEARPSSRHMEEMIPTRNGVTHYFGPSSSFRLATTIRALVTRCKAVSGADFPVLRSFHSDPTTNSEHSRNRSSTNPSDEEYVVFRTSRSPNRSQRGRKRSRTEMEGSRSTSSNPDTIGDLLPSRSLADALALAYFDNVHFHLPLFNRSMFLLRLENTYSRKTELLSECSDIGWLIALALVFSFGCQQLQDHDPEQAHKLRLKLLGFTKTYFRMLLVETCLINVQALVLLNLHHHIVGQKSSSWLLIGLAARMAITMGMHRDGPNRDFDPIERNTRRQVWWSIYTFEKILCCILGRPTVVDDREMSMQVPEAPMLEQKGMSAEYMTIVFDLVRMTYNIRQRAYFDKHTAEERSPTLSAAKTLLRECDEFFESIPAHMSLECYPMAPEQRTRILLLHIYYYYTRCIVSRNFLIQKVETNICYLENKTLPTSENWRTTLALSEDCVESAHKSLQCIAAGADLKIIGFSWLDLFYVFHSVLIVCADFLARPKDQPDSTRDVERKVTVRAVLNQIRGMKTLAPTYRILSQIAMQFASITGVDTKSPTPSAAPHDPVMTGDGATELLVEISDVREDWFANATTDLGLDFFDLSQAMDNAPSASAESSYARYFANNEVDDWTARTLKGMHTM